MPKNSCSACSNGGSYDNAYRIFGRAEGATPTPDTMFFSKSAFSGLGVLPARPVRLRGSPRIGPNSRVSRRSRLSRSVMKRRRSRATKRNPMETRTTARRPSTPETATLSFA